MINAMSLLRTITATHGLSIVDRRLPGLGTRRRVPTVDSNAHTPQSVLMPARCCTCAALLTVSMSSACGHTDLCPLGAMRSVLTAVSHVCGHWGELPSNVCRSRGSTVSRMFGARRWWVVQCRKSSSTERSRYTNSEPPSSTYYATRGPAGVCVYCEPSHPSLRRIMAWGARHCAVSATSATVQPHSSAVGPVATRKWCCGRYSSPARYSPSKALHTSAGGGGGVRAIPEPRKRPRELPSYPALPNGGLQSRQVPPEDPSNRVLPGLWPLSLPLEGNHNHVSDRGLRRELQCHPSIRVHVRAPQGSEGVSFNSTDRHPAP